MGSEMCIRDSYRLADSWTESGEVTVELLKFHAIKETPLGYWVVPAWAYTHNWHPYRDEYKRWTPKAGGRFCHESVEAAKRHYSVRKRCEMRHIKARLAKCQRVLDGWAELNEEALERDGEVNLGAPGGRLFKTLALP